ncbi:uncharacterized protein L201_002220 [Kwoniella dendrophila CBS 6074]|uniref:Phosphoglycerate mutase n=1 Tax=Kwoniella dendrophila CBS 6074 TaxID=1295534 RepID=A0AAX4JPK0_9TREE
MLIYFVRHGQTEDNVQGIIQGHKDTPLNDHGRKESERLAKRLKDLDIHEAWSSPLARAKETAEIILDHHPNIKLKLHDGIKERYLGSMEGRRRKRGEHAPDDAESSHDLLLRVTEWFDEFLSGHIPLEPLPDSHHQQQHNHHNHHHHHELGKSYHEMLVQKEEESERIDNENKSEKKILIVSHGAWLSCLLQFILHKLKFGISPKVNLNQPCYNTSIMLIKVEFNHSKQIWNGKLESWGDIKHLDDMRDQEIKEVTDDVKG